MVWNVQNVARGRMSTWLAALLAFGWVIAGPATGRVLAGGGQLELTVVDRASGLPIACRMHLKNAAGRPRKAKMMPFWHDHFVFPGKITLRLPKGNYFFELERGPEYVTRNGHFTINDFAGDSKEVDLVRFVDMSARRWWSGDLHVRRPAGDIELLMLAEDLHVVPLLTWWNDKTDWGEKPPPNELLVRFDDNRYYHVMAGGSARAGGTLLYFNLPKPLTLGGAGLEFPSPIALLNAARQYPDAWVDLSKPFWWDLPMLVANGQIDSIQIAHSLLGRRQAISNEKGGKPRDTMLFPGPWGNAQWSQAIYFHLLNCGLRIPPTAGAAPAWDPTRSDTTAHTCTWLANSPTSDGGRVFALVG